MNLLNVIILSILITLVPFYINNRKKNDINKFQVLIYGILSLAINFLLIKLTKTNDYYIEMVLTVFLTSLFNYFTATGSIDIKAFPKFIGVFSLFFLATLFQFIPVVIFNYDINNLTDNQQLILTAFSDSILLIILISIYFKTLKEDFKKIKGNFYKMMDTGIKYWILGIIVMMVSNIIIGLLTSAKAVNEESVQGLIKSSAILSVITIGVIGPIIEELVFRKSFRELIKSDTLFILLSGLVFGALHVILSFSSWWDLLYIIPYSSLGIAFGKIYQKTDSIYTSIFIHIIHNTGLTLISIAGVGFILW